MQGGYSEFALYCCVPSVMFSFVLSSRILHEHFYDAGSGSGYLAWRIKTVQCNTAVQSRRCSTTTTYQDGPKSKRDFLLTDKQLFGEECYEAISILNWLSKRNEGNISIPSDTGSKPANSSTVLDVFPRFLDTPGLVRNAYGLIYF